MKKIRILKGEFIQGYGEELLIQFQQETGKNSVWNKRVTGGFEDWLSKHESYSHIYNEIQLNIEVIEDPLKFLVEYSVGDLPEEYLINIPEELYTAKVYLVDHKMLRKQATNYLYLLLNKRFIFEQLKLELQETTKRELWYVVNQELKDDFDLAGSSKEQSISLSSKIKTFCERLILYYDVEYWGFVLDYLKIDTGERALIWNPRDFGTENESKVMTIKGLDIYDKCPFFLILCEKVATLKPVIKELIKRGYKERYYGISMKGYGTTVVIKLMLRLKKIRNFRVLVLHDLDQNGLQIYFDILKYIDCQSIGINPEFLKRFKIDKNEVDEPFKAKSKDKLDKGTITMINGLKVKKSTKKRFREWSKSCRENKIELNSIASYNLIRDSIRSKVYDLVDCIVDILEDPETAWNLNRYDKPVYSKPDLYTPFISRPKFIQDVVKEINKKVSGISNRFEELSNIITEKQKEIEEEAYKRIDEYLESKRLKFNTDWSDLIKDKVNIIQETNRELRNLLIRVGEFRRQRILRENTRFKGDNVIKYPEEIISQQSNQFDILTNRQTESLKKIVQNTNIKCRRLIKQTPEYKELKEEFKEKKEDFIKATKPKDIIKSLQKELIKVLKKPIEFKEETEEIEIDEVKLEYDEEFEDEELEDEDTLEYLEELEDE